MMLGAVWGNQPNPVQIPLTAIRYWWSGMLSEPCIRHTSSVASKQAKCGHLSSKKDLRLRERFPAGQHIGLMGCLWKGSL